MRKVVSMVGPYVHIITLPFLFTLASPVAAKILKAPVHLGAIAWPRSNTLASVSAFDTQLHNFACVDLRLSVGTKLLSINTNIC